MEKENIRSRMVNLERKLSKLILSKGKKEEIKALVKENKKLSQRYNALEFKDSRGYKYL